MCLRLVFHGFSFDCKSNKKVNSTILVLVLVPTKRCELSSKSQELNPENLILTWEIKYSHNIGMYPDWVVLSFF